MNTMLRPGCSVRDRRPVRIVAILFVEKQSLLFLWYMVEPGQTMMAKRGNTVRITGLPGLRLVLVAGTDPPSLAWLHAVSQPGVVVRHFVTEADVHRMGSRLHARPLTVPAFLVCADGWVVDWFAAPRPTVAAVDGGERALTPTDVNAFLRGQMQSYATPGAVPVPAM